MRGILAPALLGGLSALTGCAESREALRSLFGDEPSMGLTIAFALLGAILVIAAILLALNDPLRGKPGDSPPKEEPRPTPRTSGRRPKPSPRSGTKQGPSPKAARRQRRSKAGKPRG